MASLSCGMEMIPREIARVLILVFFAVLFLQSGLDKIFDFDGNRAYIKSVFEKTLPARIVSILFVVLLVLEVTTGVACALGAAGAFFSQPALGKWAMVLAAVCLIQLFAGLRIAHDYQGAAAIVPYFLAAVLGILLHA